MRESTLINYLDKYIIIPVVAVGVTATALLGVQEADVRTGSIQVSANIPREGVLPEGVILDLRDNAQASQPKRKNPKRRAIDPKYSRGFTPR